MHVEWPRNIQIVRMELASRCMRRIAHPFDFSVRSQALPTELMLALFTRHVLAAVNLLDSPSAVHAGTLLRELVEHRFFLLLFVSFLLPTRSVLVLITSLVRVPGDLVL